VVRSFALGLSVFLAWAPGVAGAQARLDAGVALSSQLVDRGLAITSPAPILQGELGWSFPTGWSTGLAAGVDLRTPGQPVLALARISRGWRPSADWLTEASLLYYDYGRSGVPDRLDASVYVTYRDAVTFGVSAGRIDHVRGPRILGAIDASASRALGRQFSLSASAGVAQAMVAPARPGGGYPYYPGSYGPYAYGHRQERLRHYGYGHLGLAWSAGAWRIQLDRHLNSLGPRHAYGTGASAGWVATVAWSR
jgi:hypothetical protein